MKTVNMMKYRLRRYFCSSRPVIPLIVTVCFLGVMYSIKPMNVGSGYVMSGVLQFILMVFVTLNMVETQEMVEEQLLLLHGNSKGKYFLAKEVTLLVISGIYGVILTIGPVVVNWINHFTFFNRKLTAYDVAMGAVIIIGSGLAGTAIGMILHPRIIGDRKLAVMVSVGLMILSIAKDGIIEEYAYFKLFGMLLPSVMKPARDLGNGDFFELSAVVIFFLSMAVYYCIVCFCKNIILSFKKFS